MRSKKQIASGQRRTLKAMKSRLIDMAAEWDGEDQYCMNSLDELATKVQETSDLLLEDAT